MFRNRAVIIQVLQVFLGIVICTGLMLGVYALIGQFSLPVLWGALLGCLIAGLNFLFLSIGVTRAADRAEATGEAAKATLAVRSSSTIRMLALAAIYIVILKSGVCDPLAAVLPLIFVRISITMLEFFRKDGEK